MKNWKIKPPKSSGKYDWIPGSRDRVLTPLGTGIVTRVNVWYDDLPRADFSVNLDGGYAARFGLMHLRVIDRLGPYIG